MNGTYYNNPTFPNDIINPNSPPANISSMSISLEQSLIENILRLNKGREVCVYASYPDSNEWRDKKFTGIIKEAGKDHLIVSNENNNYLIRLLYVNYIEFDKPINYNPDYSDTFK